MNITKIQIILLLFVVFCMIHNNDIKEGLNTFKWSDYGRVVSSPPTITKPVTDCASGGSIKTGLTGVTSCAIVSDDCFIETGTTKQKKQDGASCTAGGATGSCHDVSGKFTCAVNSNTLSTAITANISANIPAESSAAIPNNSSVYAIKKTGKTKTHSAACIETNPTACDPLISTNGAIDCSGINSGCCLCDDSKWTKIYTSKYSDTLAGTSKPLTDLPALFPNYSSTPPPGSGLKTSRDQYSVFKPDNPSYGLYTDISSTGGDFKRYFPIKTYVNNDAPLDTQNTANGPNYTVSSGYFMDNKNELQFDLTLFPGYIESSPTSSQLGDSFYYEECLYQKDPTTNKCVCPNNKILSTTDKSHSSNQLCVSCPAGQSVQSGACVPCSNTNQFYDNALNTCAPCNTTGANNRKIYREDPNSSNLGTCVPVNSVSNGGVIRTDCVENKPNPIPVKYTQPDCNVYSYGSRTSDVPQYHLSNEPPGGPTLNDFYTACGTKSGCQVVQTLIGDTVEAGLESYVNFYTPPPAQTPAPSPAPATTKQPTTLATNNNLAANVKPEFNMVTNEYCIEETDESRCKQLKQCNWYPNTSAVGTGSTTGTSSIANKGTCMIDPKYNQYNHGGITYNYIPIPDHVPMVENGEDSVLNQLDTSCTDRIQSECTADHKCQWVSSSCVSYCNSISNKATCEQDNTCSWNGSACSKKADTALSCGVPSITTTDRYKLTGITSLGQSASQTDFNSNVKCRGLIDAPHNVEFSGDAKGICFSGTSSEIMGKTGCIPSHIMNNITLHKSPAKIISAAATASAADPNLPNRGNLGIDIPKYTLDSNTYIGSAANNCSYYNSCLTTSETLPTLSPPSKPVTQTMNPTPIQSNTVIPYTELSNAPYLINRCRELCIKNPTICDDYGVKFPTSSNANTDEGCYLMKGRGSLNTALISVTFDPPIVLHYGVTYYPCSIKLKKKPGEKTLPDNIKNVVGVIGTNTHPLDIPYIYRLYSLPSPQQITKALFDVNIPGLPNIFSGFYLSGTGIIGGVATVYPNSASDTVTILTPRCKPSKTLTPLENNWINWFTCSSGDSSSNAANNMKSATNGQQPPKTSYINSRGLSGAIINSAALECPSSCTSDNTANVGGVIKQFKLGKTSDLTYLYFHSIPAGTTHPTNITDIATLIPGMSVDLQYNPTGSTNIVWGNPSVAHMKGSVDIYHLYRAGALIYPNKINISNGGILKQNHSKDESRGDIEIMKLYILEGSSSIKFNLVGKRLADGAGKARPDWKIENIVLPIQPDPQQGVRNYTAEFVISDL